MGSQGIPVHRKGHRQTVQESPGPCAGSKEGGDGTTLVAAEELGRRWIGVDSGLEAIATTVKRLANGSEPMGDFVKGKKPKEQTLFDDPSILRTNFDLYLAEGPARPSTELLQAWQ